MAERVLRRALLLAAAAALLPLAACSAGEGARAEGTVIHARLNADILSSDPGSKRELNTDAVLAHVVEGLVAARRDGSVGALLARDWTVSPDGRTYFFRLREGLEFHDGTPVTSKEVVWSLDRYLAPESRWRCKPELEGGIADVLSVKADGPLGVVIELDRAAPLFLATLARTDCAGTGIVSPRSVGKDGAWVAPIGTGPFAWGEWRRKEYVELRRFAGYRALAGQMDGNTGGKHAYADRLRFRVIPDGSAASAALMRGSLDVLDGLAPNELASLRGEEGIRLISAPIMDFYGVLFQVKDPLLADLRLRRAIALSLDIRGLTEAATHGLATPASSPIPSASPWFGPVQRRIVERDLPAARRFAKAAGYDGRPIRLITSRAYPEAFDAAILVQAMAREAGINIEIVTLDWASQLERYTTGDYQAMVFTYSARLDPAFLVGAFTGNKREEPRKVWDTPRAHRLLARAFATSDGAERQAVFDEMDEAFREEVPAIILYNTSRVTALREGVSGFRPWPAQLQRLWNVKVAR